MTQQEREKLQRALGIIDGMVFVASNEVSNALAYALEILEGVIKKEENK